MVGPAVFHGETLGAVTPSNPNPVVAEISLGRPAGATASRPNLGPVTLRNYSRLSVGMAIAATDHHYCRRIALPSVSIG